MLCCLVVCGASSAAAEPASSNEAAHVLTDADVVQRLAAGATIDELIDLIARSVVDFDTSPEMQDELRRAGLPDRVIRAMTRRQELMNAPVDLQEGAKVTLSLNQGEADPDKRWVRLNEKIDKRLIKEWQLSGLERRESTELRFEDIAIFLVCCNADHAPDAWRKWSPLTDRLRPVPKHKLLAIAPGAEWALPGFWHRWGIRPSLGSTTRSGQERVSGMASLQPRNGPMGILELEIPHSLQVWLEPETRHDLMVGIAVKIGSGYHVWRSARLDGLRLEENDDVRLEARIDGTRSKKIHDYGIELMTTAARRSGSD